MKKVIKEQTIPSIWAFVVLCIGFVLFSLTSCEKNEPQPTQTQSLITETKYVRIGDSIHVEADTIIVYDNNGVKTISNPIKIIDYCGPKGILTIYTFPLQFEKSDWCIHNFVLEGLVTIHDYNNTLGLVYKVYGSFKYTTPTAVIYKKL